MRAIAIFTLVFLIPEGNHHYSLIENDVGAAVVTAFAMALIYGFSQKSLYRKEGALWALESAYAERDRQRSHH